MAAGSSADALALRDHYEYDLARTLARRVLDGFEDPPRENLTPGWRGGPTVFHPTRATG